MGAYLIIFPPPLFYQDLSFLKGCEDLLVQHDVLSLRLSDYTDPEVMWRALWEMAIPPKLAKAWFYAWCSFQGKYIPQQLRDKIENLK